MTSDPKRKAKTVTAAGTSREPPRQSRHRSAVTSMAKRHRILSSASLMGQPARVALLAQDIEQNRRRLALVRGQNCDSHH